MAAPAFPVFGSSAKLLFTYQNQSTNITWASDATWIVFPTTQDATNYLNAMNKTNYSLASTQYVTGGAYYNVTGHDPQIYKRYAWNEGNPLDISAYRGHIITQLDNLISIDTAKRLS